MSSEVLEIEQILQPDSMAVEISNKYVEWQNLRSKWLEERRELRNYLFATDTKTTSNKSLPWSNSTTTPKLTQIYDNLQANYFKALFPNEGWFDWISDNDEAEEKKPFIKAYVKNKVDGSGFINTVEELLDDYIRDGNAFCKVNNVNITEVKESGEVVQRYVGPQLERISPYDIVFNPTVKTFEKTPKIIKSVFSLGQLEKMVLDGKFPEEVLEKTKGARKSVLDVADTNKGDGFIADGFSSIREYYESETFEVLSFFGDIYNKTDGRLETNRSIDIIDRTRVIQNVENPSWNGSIPIFHVGWRLRPDNLYAMGPLDNLVGLQYRIDHLENLKADAWDQVVYPKEKIKGDVEDYENIPGERIYVGDEGDVTYLSPDVTILQTDLQIKILEDRMEEMAGAPKEAMGIRTPGEKTAFEFGGLTTRADRIFNNKTNRFDRHLLEKVLNEFLEVGRRNLSREDLIRIFDEDLGVASFESITKEDITARGNLKPIGSRHFAEKERRLQNLNTLIQVSNIPQIVVHLSGKKMAKMIAEEIGEPSLYSENILISEQEETKQMSQELEGIGEDQQLAALEEGI